MLAIRLPPEIEKRLDKLAKRSGRTKTYYAREAILRHLEDLEDVYLAEKALTAIRQGRSKTIPLKEVMKRYGMDDRTFSDSGSQPRRSRSLSGPPDREIPVRARRQTRKSA